MEVKSVLLVCSANVARSVLAEHLLRKILNNNHALVNVKCTSAGINAVEGQPASSKVSSVLRKQNLDVSSHSAKPVTKQLLQTADLVLVMEREHKDFISSQFPEARNKTFTLKEFTGEDNLDTVEPLGLDSFEGYEQLANEMQKSLVKVTKKLG